MIVKKNKITKKKSFEFFIFFLLGSIFFSLIFTNYFGFFYQHGDSAFLVDLIYKIGQENKIYSSIAASHGPMISHLSVNPDKYCLFGNQDVLDNSDIFKNGHLYLIVFLLSFFNKLGVNALILSSITFALNFSLIILSIYFFLKNKIQKLYIFFFLIILFFWLPFSMSWIGQFYFDRLFILPMLLLIFLVNDFDNIKNNKIIFFILLFYITIIHERAALMAGCFLISHLIFFYNQNQKYTKLLLFSGFSLIFYFLIYVKFIQISYYSNNYTFSNILHNIQLILKNVNNMQDLSIKFFLINSFFLFLSIFNIRYFLISFATLLPNLFITIGGAEKTALTTHYHTYYIPFVISGAVFGFVRLKQILTEKRYLIFTCLFTIICLLFNLHYDFSSRDKIFNFNKLGRINHSMYLQKSFPYLFEDYWRFHINNTKITSNFLKKIEPDARVSVHENAQVFFSMKKNLIDFFPLGIGKSDYLVVLKNNDKIDDSIVFESFLGQDQRNKIINCIKMNIALDYYLIDKLVMWHGGSLSIYKKKT
jgi:hypothetical protein